MKQRKEYLMSEDERMWVWYQMADAGYKVRRKHIQKIVNKRQALTYVCPMGDKMVMFTPSLEKVVAITI
jgi:hypothetical protein